MTKNSEDEYKYKYRKYNEQIQDNEFIIKKLETNILNVYDTKVRFDIINDELKKLTEPLHEIDEDLLHSFIYKMISVNPELVIFCVAGTKNYDDKEFSAR